MDDETTLKYRLRFDIKETARWLRDLANNSVEPSAMKRVARDARLVGLVTDTDVDVTGLLARLKAAASIGPLLIDGDLTRVRRLLYASNERLGTHVQSYDGRENLREQYAALVRAYVSELQADQALKELREFATQVKPNTMAADGFCAGFADLHFGRWIIEKEDLANTCLNIVLDSYEQLLGSVSRFTAEGGVLSALLSVVHRSKLVHVSPAVRERALRLVQSVHKSQDERLPDATSLMLNLSLEDEARRDALLGDWIGRIGQSLEGSSFRESVEAMERACALLSDLFDFFESSAAIQPLQELVLKGVLEHRTELLRSIELNPRSAFYFARVTSLMMRSETNREFARGLLLELVSRSSHAVQHLARVLSPDLWGDNWSDASDSVLRLAHGRRDDELGYRLMVIKLVGSLPTEGSGTNAKLPAPWQALVHDTLLSVSDPNGLVANHAAYAVMHFAEAVEQQDLIGMVVRSFQAVSEDPRTIVRMAAGYGAARLLIRARSTLVKDAAGEIAERLASDPYVSVQRELRFGGIEAKNQADSINS
jgi:hypothetical protein